MTKGNPEGFPFFVAGLSHCGNPAFIKSYQQPASDNTLHCIFAHFFKKQTVNIK